MQDLLTLVDRHALLVVLAVAAAARFLLRCRCRLQRNVDVGDRWTRLRFWLYLGLQTLNIVSGLKRGKLIAGRRYSRLLVLVAQDPFEVRSFASHHVGSYGRNAWRVIRFSHSLGGSG